jgi:hypothetical protein
VQLESRIDWQRAVATFLAPRRRRLADKGRRKLRYFVCGTLNVAVGGTFDTVLGTLIPGAGMRQRLAVEVPRPISNVVDVTNYVMNELGNPPQVNDLDEILGHSFQVKSGAVS